MNDLNRAALFRRISLTVLLLACAFAGSSGIPPSGAAPLPPPNQALVYVPLPTADARERLEAMGLPIFALDGAAPAAYALTGADEEGLRRLAAAGVRYRILDADVADASFYFAMLPPNRPQPRWSAFGSVLFQDAAQTFLQATPADADLLAEQGVELRQLVLAPIIMPQAQAAASPASVMDPRLTTPKRLYAPIVAAAMGAADPLVQGMIDQVTAAAAQGYVEQLSGVAPIIVGGTPYTLTTRHTNSGTPIAKATQFASEHLAGLGLAVAYHNWTTSGFTNRNVIGQYTGVPNPGDIYIIGAHLDDMPTGGTAPGADDNASGSAATLIAADILSQYQWGCTLRFALWTGEEQGMLGSYVYAARARSSNETIKGYLNLDMLGYNSASPRNIDLYYRATPGGSEQIADTLVNVVNAYGLDLVPLKYNVATYTTGNYSDNKSFWDQGYPAILAIEDIQGGDRTPYYHKATDVLATLDMAYFTTFVKAAVGTFVHMSDCLLTGALGGGVTASHDGSAIAGASVAMTDTHSLAYSASADGAGRYARTLPAATYRMTASAYGYLPQTFTDLELGTGGRTQNFVLQAALPVAPPVTTSVVGAEGVHLVWTHGPPNMTYTVHRASNPYFTPALANQQKSLAFTEPLIYDDLTGTGNRFYAVVGKNAAGVAALPDRAGIFNFALQPGDG